MPSTINYVARDAQVSIATVSRVLAGNYPVAEATRERVLNAVAAHHYTANPNARRLRGADPRPIAVLLGSITGPSFASLAQGVESASRDRSRVCLIGATAGDADRELELVELMRRQRASAVILPGGFWRDQLHRERMARNAELLARDGARLILCGNRSLPSGTEGVIHIRYDNLGGARRIAQHVADRGHRRVLILPGHPTSDTSVERLEGFLSAFDESDRSQVLIRTTSFDREPAKAAVAEVLSENESMGPAPAITAIVCATDQMAAGALEALRERGLRCPEDISVTGYDDVPAARDLNPALTTVRVPYERMGEMAVELALTESTINPPVLPTELVERQSVINLG